jgi:hypothetical protein
MAIGHAFLLFSFFPVPYSVFSSVFRVQPSADPDPISTQSCLNRSSIAGGHNHETPDIHQQDSSYREAQ